MANPSPLSPETAGAIDAIVRQISVAHHLDADIRGELRAHIEDKVHAYLNGDLAQGESDAVVLAKAHFGSPAVIQSLLARAHGQRRPASRRRLIALTLAGCTLVAIALFLSQWLTGEIKFRRANQDAIVLPEGMTIVPLGGKLPPKIVLPCPESSESTIPRGSQKRLFNGRTFYIVPLQS